MQTATLDSLSPEAFKALEESLFKRLSESGSLPIPKQVSLATHQNIAQKIRSNPSMMEFQLETNPKLRMEMELRAIENGIPLFSYMEGDDVKAKELREKLSKL